MPLSSAGRVQRSSPIGSYVMATAEHREPCESRGSRTVLGARGGEIPPRDSTFATDANQHQVLPCPLCPESDRQPFPSHMSLRAMKRREQVQQ